MSGMEHENTSVMDVRCALDRLDGDRSLLRQLGEIFIGDAPDRLAAISKAIRAGDLKGLEREAHTVKSAAGNFAASNCVDAARRLEMQAREGRPEEFESLEAALRLEVGRLVAALKSL